MSWSWATIIAFFSGNTLSLEAHLDRLKRNQQDIGDAFILSYGEKAAHHLARELTTHIDQGAQVLAAKKDGDNAALEEALKSWYANAKDIADFLSSLNPENWPQQEFRTMMKGHIDSTLVYVDALLVGDYPTAIAAFDEADVHMMHMADILALGMKPNGGCLGRLLPVLSTFRT